MRSAPRAWAVLLVLVACNGPISDWPSTSDNDAPPQGMPGDASTAGPPGTQDAGLGHEPPDREMDAALDTVDAGAGVSLDAGACLGTDPDAALDAASDAAPDGGTDALVPADAGDAAPGGDAAVDAQVLDADGAPPLCP